MTSLSRVSSHFWRVWIWSVCMRNSAATGVPVSAAQYSSVYDAHDRITSSFYRRYVLALQGDFSPFSSILSACSRMNLTPQLLDHLLEASNFSRKQLIQEYGLPPPGVCPSAPLHTTARLRSHLCADLHPGSGRQHIRAHSVVSEKSPAVTKHLLHLFIGLEWSSDLHLLHSCHIAPAFLHKLVGRYESFGLAEGS